MPGGFSLESYDSATRRLPAVGAVDGFFEETPEMLIHAHTIRDEGLNCFMTVNDVPYLIFVRSESDGTTGFVVQYSIEEFNTFNLEDTP